MINIAENLEGFIKILKENFLQTKETIVLVDRGELDKFSAKITELNAECNPVSGTYESKDVNKDTVALIVGGITIYFVTGNVQLVFPN